MLGVPALDTGLSVAAAAVIAHEVGMRSRIASAIRG